MLLPLLERHQVDQKLFSNPLPVLSGQAAYPFLELPVERGCAYIATLYINLGYGVISFVKKLKALLNAIARKQIIERRFREPLQKHIEIVFVYPAMSGRIAQVKVGV